MNNEVRDLYVRQANKKDLKYILNIYPDLFDSMDYLPWVYHELMHDQLVICFVGEKDVSIECASANACNTPQNECLQMYDPPT